MNGNTLLSSIDTDRWPWEEKSLQELNDIPEERGKLLEEFRKEALALQNSKAYLTLPIDDDEFLMIFLRTRKFNVHDALECLDNFYQIRLCCSDLVLPVGKGPKDFAYVLDKPLVTVLNKRNPIDGSLLILWSFRNFESKDGNLVDMLNVSIYAVMEALNHPSVQTYGIRYVFDLGELKLTTVMLMITSLHYLKALIKSQNGVPARFKGMHYINDPFSMAQMVYKLIRPALSQKMQERFYFHGKNLEELFTHVGEDVLPVEFGGKAVGCFDEAHWFRQAMYDQHENIFRRSHFGYK